MYSTILDNYLQELVMKTRLLTIVIFFLIVVVICSCKTEPELSDEATTIAKVGLRTEDQIAYSFQNNGSYSGVSQSSTGTGTVYYLYNNATASVDCSDLGLGTITVKLSGQVRASFPNYPSMYPNIYTYDISYSYLGKTHTLEYEINSTGVSSSETTRLKIDGTNYLR